MQRFHHFLAIDWSGAKGARHKGIALAMSDAGCANAGGADAANADAASGPPVLLKPPPGGWSRGEVLALLQNDLPPETLVGMDLGIALPFLDCGAYFPGWAQSPAGAKALWALVESICGDDPYFEATSFISHQEASRYFRHAKGGVGEHFLLPSARSREGRFRRTEEAQRAHGVRPVSNFNLVGSAQVGKASLTGMRLLHRLQKHIAIWPITPLPERGSVIVEMYTALAARGGGISKGRSKLNSYEALNAALTHMGSAPVPGSGPIDDHSSDALLSAAWLRKIGNKAQYWHPAGLNQRIAETEGWTFGAL